MEEMDNYISPLSCLKNAKKSKALLGFLVAILVLGDLLSMPASNVVKHLQSLNTNIRAFSSSNYHRIESIYPGIVYNQSSLNSNNISKKSLFPDDADISFQATEFTQIAGTFFSRIDFNNNPFLMNLKLTYLFSDIPPPSSHSQ